MIILVEAGTGAPPKSSDAAFVNSCRTVQSLPLVRGPYRVPFLLNLPGRSHRVSGELYAVSPATLARMDDLEGMSWGHYERLPIEIETDDVAGNGRRTAAHAYYAHGSYAEALWMRSDEEAYGCYTEKVARGYAKRKDRATDVSFLDQFLGWKKIKLCEIILWLPNQIDGQD